MSHKSEANQLIQAFFSFQFINTQVDKFIKAIRTGNAKEFQLTTFLQKVEAAHQFSCSHRPEKFFEVEIKHQHLLSVARALLFQSKVSIFFRGECISTSAFLINKTPFTSLRIPLLINCLLTKNLTIPLSNVLNVRALSPLFQHKGIRFHQELFPAFF